MSEKDQELPPQGDRDTDQPFEASSAHIASQSVKDAVDEASALPSNEASAVEKLDEAVALSTPDDTPTQQDKVATGTADAPHDHGASTASDATSPVVEAERSAFGTNETDHVDIEITRPIVSSESSSLPIAEEAPTQAVPVTTQVTDGTNTPQTDDTNTAKTDTHSENAEADTAQAGDTVVAHETSSQAASTTVEATAQPAPAPAPTPTPTPTPSVDRVAESIWAAVRDREPVLSGEEVTLESPALPDTRPAAAPTEESGTQASAVPAPNTSAHDTDQGAAETLGSATGQETQNGEDRLDNEDAESSYASAHTTTIPVMSADDAAAVRQAADISTDAPVEDVLRNRFDDASVDEDIQSEIEDTIVQRRSLMAAVDTPDAPAAGAWKPRADNEEVRPLPSQTPQSLDDALFDGASLAPEMPSRSGAHWWSLILFLLFVPFAWFLAADAGARMALNPAGPGVTGNLSPTALIELSAAVVLAFILVLASIRSSLGAWVSGVIMLIVGLPWLFAPAWTRTVTEAFLAWVSNLHVVGGNFAHHIQASGYSGRLTLLALGLIALGMVSHSVRRRGRKEEALRAEVEVVNPTGAHFTARARRKAEKAAGLR